MFYNVNDLSTKRDVGSQPGTQWLLSSHKLGNGVAQLRDDNLSTLWQSDGQQPHTVSIQFAKRTPVTHLSIYLDYTLDDSYTATKILIKAGTHYHDLQEVRTREFVEPKGWKSFLLDKADPLISEEDDNTSIGPPQPPIYVNLIQICILANHLNGKDTHVRSIKVFSPSLSSPIHNLSSNDEINSKIGLNGRYLNGKSNRKIRDEKIKLFPFTDPGYEKTKAETGVIGVDGKKKSFSRSKNLKNAKKKALKSFDFKPSDRDLIIKREDGTKAVRVSDSEMESEEEDEEEDSENSQDYEERFNREKIQFESQQSLRSRDDEEELKKFTKLLPGLSKGFGSGSFGLR